MAIKDSRGFWKNRRGEFVHPDMVRTDEKIKDEMIEKLFKRVDEIREILSEFKKDAFGEVEGYFDLLLQEYGVDAKARSKKGNITLEDFSGVRKVSVAVNDTVAFDEKLSIAKLKIDECLHEWTKDSGSELKTLVNRAFDVDKKGEISVSKVMALKSYDISHPKWIEAMNIIDEATQVVSSKQYIRFYSREDETANYKQLSLDFSKIEPKE